MGKVKKINAALDVAAANAEPIAAPIAAAAAISKKRGPKKTKPKFQSYLKRMAKEEKLPFLSSNVIEILDNAVRVLLTDLSDGVLQNSKGGTITQRHALLAASSLAVDREISDKTLTDLLTYAKQSVESLKPVV